jgi:outer membrane protein assembly factor BamB
MNRLNTLLTTAVATATLSLAAGTVSAATLLALGADGQLFKIDSTSQKVTATMASNSPSPLRGLDVRPANGMLYALGTDNQLYTLDAATGAASKVASLNKQLPGSGQAVIDFNPVADKMRMLAADGTNFRVNVETGEVVVDGSVAYDTEGPYKGKSAQVVAGAYTNSYAGTQATSLYNVDLASSSLMLQNPPNDGVQQAVGKITDGLKHAAMDIASDGKGGNTAYLLTGTTLHTIDLASGKPMTLGDVADLPANIIDIAVMPAM